MMRPFRFVPSDFSHDTAEVATRLYQQASEGKAIGAAMVVMYEDGLCMPVFTGEVYRSPIWSSGAVNVLQAKLIRMAESGSE